MSETRSSFLGFQPPAVGEEEVAAVAETIRSGWLTTGPRAAELERRMAEFLEAKHVLAVTSGTAALHLSLLAVGVGPGDEVITTSVTWPACSLCPSSNPLPVKAAFGTGRVFASSRRSFAERTADVGK